MKEAVIKLIQITGRFDVGHFVSFSLFGPRACNSFSKLHTNSENSPAILAAMDLMASRFFSKPIRVRDSDILSMREKDVLNLIAKGLISREIGDILYISVNTVNTHRQNIIEKLNVRNTSEAIQYAMNIGILGKQD